MHDEEFNWELIVHRLDSIARHQECTTNQLTLIEGKLTKLETMKHSVDDLKSWRQTIQDTVSVNELKELRVWKQNMDEITSPTQLQGTLDDIKKLNTFKAQALIIWVVVQGIMGLLIFFDKIFCVHSIEINNIIIHISLGHLTTFFFFGWF